MLKAGIVILNYNDAIVTMNLALLISQYKSLNNIIIVDNCSTDDSYNRLCLIKSDKIDVIKSDMNSGYAYGNNFGIKYLISNYYIDVIFIANPDVKFNEDFILQILENFNTTDYAMLSGVMLDSDGKISSSQSWKIPTYFDDIIDSFAIFNKLRHLNTYVPIDKSKKIVDVEVLSGSLFAIRKAVIESIGYFDEGTFLYCEERILGNKLKKMEYKIGILNNIQYIHIHGSSIKKNYQIIQMRKILLESRFYYEVKYNKINILQKLIFKICIHVALVEYRAILLSKSFFYSFKCMNKRKDK